MIRIFLTLLFLSCLALAQEHNQTSLGDIRGRITVSSKDDFAEEIFHGRAMIRYGDQANKSKSIQPYKLSEKAVVYIESVQGTTTYQPPVIHSQLNQQDLIFRPLLLPVVIGTTVDFPNNDNVFHNVFSYSQAKEFDLGRYPKGKTKSVTFDKPGVISVYCEIHAYMFATILVLENPFFTVPDDEGLYTLSHIPPGTYQLSFWYGRKKVETKNVTVKVSEITTVNFTY